jgi:hypothetical protein
MRLSPWSGPGKWLGALALLVALAVVGCGGGVGKGTVSGKVTYKGAPLKGGRVAFSTSNNQAVMADIGEDGSYTTPEMTTGPAKISVQTSYMKQMVRVPANRPPKDQKMPEGYQMGGDPEAAKHYVAIPAQYEKADTSGLTYDVKRGSQNHDINLQ